MISGYIFVYLGVYLVLVVSHLLLRIKSDIMPHTSVLSCGALVCVRTWLLAKQPQSDCSPPSVSVYACLSESLRA